MPRREKYVPKHRNAPAEPALKKSLRKSVTYSGVAVAATGIAVTSGLAFTDGPPSGAAISAAGADAGVSNDTATAEQPVADELARRGNDVSRSASRPALDDAKKESLDQESGGQVTKTADLTGEDPRDIARALLPEYGFSASEFSCLDALYVSESDWDMHADNPTSSAYGIPQALTGGTHDLPDDYMTNPVSQIRWGLEYIRDSYGTPCAAWSFKQSHNWY